MTPGMIGALVGLLFGVASWRATNLLSQRVEKEETKRLLRIVAGLELLLLPAIGYMIGTHVYGSVISGATP